MLLAGSALTTHAQKLKFLIPDEAIVQYAGSIGYFSAGAGYEVFGNKRGNLSFHYGYVPENKGGQLHITTVKLAYKPWQIALKDWGTFYPFNPGLFVSYTFHKDLSVAFPSGQYPGDYYYWSEAIRPHLSFNSEIELNAPAVLKKSGVRALGLYIEANTNDYYLINYLQNTSALKIDDIFQLGIGLRAKF
jgi:hypothetical protein